MLKTKKAILLLSAIIAFAGCGRKGDLIIPGTVLPRAVSDLKVRPKEGAAVLSWTVPDKNTSGETLTDLAGFDIYRAEIPEGQDECPCRFERVSVIDLEKPGGAEVEGKKVMWSDRGPGLVYGRRYAYKVTGLNTDGYAGEDSGTVKIVYLAPPHAPAGLAALPGDMSVSLGWGAVETDGEGKPVGDLAGYNVYRSTGRDAEPGGPVNGAPVAETSLRDPGLKNGVTYFYRVSALRGKEPPLTEGAPSELAAATPLDAEPPSTPQGLQAVPGEGIVLLSWEPSPEPDTAGYVVYRQAGDETAPVRLTDKPVQGITYKDADVKPGAGYAYSVSAVDDAEPPNESAMSGPVELIVPQPPL